MSASQLVPGIPGRARVDDSARLVKSGGFRAPDFRPHPWAGLEPVARLGSFQPVETDRETFPIWRNGLGAELRRVSPKLSRGGRRRPVSSDEPARTGGRWESSPPASPAR